MLLLTLLVRIPGLTRPLVGNFATRNVVQAMAARNWARGEAPWWRPTLDCLADGQPAWHLVEVPCSAYLTAALWKTFGGSLDTWGRTTAIAWSVLSAALIYDLVRRRAGDVAAGAAAFTLAVAPISVIYGQSFLLEPSVVALTLAAWWGTERYARYVQTNTSPTRQRGGEVDERSNPVTRNTTSVPPRWRVGLVLAVAVCLPLTLLWLTKVYMVVVALPLAWLVWSESPPRSWRNLLPFAAILLIAALPTLWWCYRVWQLAGPGAPSAERVYYSLFSSATEHGFPHELLFDPAFYRRFLLDLGTVVLTPLGAIGLMFGAQRVAWRKWWPVGVAMLLLLVAMPRKFHEMNYYHLLFLPVWAAMIGLGWKHLAACFAPSRWATTAVIAIVLLFSARYSLRPAFVTPAEDRSVIQAAEALRTLAAPDDKIIASHGTTLDLLYYADRRGWAMPVTGDDVAQRIEGRRAEGAKWLVIAGKSELFLPELAEVALQKYPVAASGVGFRVYRLEAAEAGTRDESAAKTAMPTAPGAK
ncbi:MAG: hypothetical protein SGJ19_13225 [Planctomycetia bacterium]|nr:hypothetical protein [Planctomycetia bacterium]